MSIHARSILVPLLLVFHEIANYLSNDMYLPALPQMMQDLGLTMHQAQLTLTMWFLGGACMPFAMGAISDRFGRRPVLLVGGVIYILATILCAITSNHYMLLIARFVEGSMVASMIVPGYACIHELYEKKEAIKLLALMGSISVLAPAFGPLLGGIVLYFTSWRAIFWFIAVWAAVALLLLNKWMPETLPPEKRQPLHLGFLLKSYGKIISNIHFILLMCVLGFNFAGFIAWITASPLLVTGSFHYSAIAFGIIQALVFGAYIFGNRWVKYLLDSIGIMPLIRLGLFIALLGGSLILLSAVCFPNSLSALIVSMMIYSFGSALCFSPLNRVIIETSDEPMGVRVALFSVCFTSFGVLGSAMSSVFFDGTELSLACLIAAAIGLSCVFKMLSVAVPQTHIM